jgi:carbon storage regulator
MLYLTRKIGESIIINDEIRLTVIGITGRVVKLGFVYPENAKVLREEIYERIQRENELAIDDAQDIRDSIEGGGTQSMHGHHDQSDEYEDYRFVINE